MLNKEEGVAILIATLVLGVSVSFLQSFDLLLTSFLSVFILLMGNISAKKITSYYLDSQIRIKLWEITKYGFSAKKRFKRPFPAGAFLPIIITAFSLGFIKWMGSLVFEVRAKVYRAAKRHGLYSYSEMSEFHIGLIAASGIIANLLLAVIGYLIGFQIFAKLNILYAFFNLFPISNLDGNKIFFGNIVFWSFLMALTLVGVIAVILVT